MGASSSSPSKDTGPKEPGLSKLKTTGVFRAVNFELFAKQNKVTMSLGTAVFLGCLGYIAYLRLTDEHKGKNMYFSMNHDGTLTRRERPSKWD